PNCPKSGLRVGRGPPGMHRLGRAIGARSRKSRRNTLLGCQIPRAGQPILPEERIGPPAPPGCARGFPPMTVIAATTPALLPDVCGRFQEATGWALRFRAIEGPSDAQKQALGQDPSCGWSISINDGHRPAGLLWLEHPRNEEPAVSLFDASRLAEAIA